MRLLFVSNLYPPYAIGGYERLAAWTADGLAERGHGVEVLTGDGPALRGRPGVHPELDLDLPALVAAQRDAGIEFPATWRASWRRHVASPRQQRACLRRLEAVTPELLSAWNLAFVTRAPLAAARRLGVPAVLHASDVALNPFRNPHPPAVPGPLRRVARAVVDAQLRRARPRRVLVPSRFLRDQLLLREPVEPARLEVVPWPIPPDVVRETVPTRPPDAARRILYVGSLVPEKGVLVLAEAFRRAHAVRSELALTLAGDGPRAVVAGVREALAGLPARVVGPLERPAVIAAYREHGVLAFPSVWDEPFALVPLEAMALGLVVVATGTGGTPEAVEDGRCGRLVAPRDAAGLAAALLRCADEPEATRALGRRAAETVRTRHGFAAYLDRVEALYADAARPAPGGQA